MNKEISKYINIEIDQVEKIYIYINRYIQTYIYCLCVRAYVFNDMCYSCIAVFIGSLQLYTKKNYLFFSSAVKNGFKARTVKHGSAIPISDLKIIGTLSNSLIS